MFISAAAARTTTIPVGRGAVALPAPARWSLGRTVTASQVPVPAKPGVPWKQLGHLKDDRLNEVSGVAVSRTRPRTMWVHNDSGDSARVFAIDAKGETRVEVKLEGASAFDWEDIALGRGPDGRDWVYVADTGDNLRIRQHVSIYRFPEDSAGTEGETSVRPERIDVEYPGWRPHDVEAMLLDPRSGDLLLVTKVREGAAQVLQVPAAELRAGTSAKARVVGELPGLFLLNGGDISADGSTIALRNYGLAFVWKRSANESVADALRREPITFDAPDGSESLGFTPDGASLISIPEGEGATISRIAVPRAPLAPSLP